MPSSFLKMIRSFFPFCLVLFLWFGFSNCGLALGIQSEDEAKKEDSKDSTSPVLAALGISGSSSAGSGGTGGGVTPSIDFTLSQNSFTFDPALGTTKDDITVGFASWPDASVSELDVGISIVKTGGAALTPSPNTHTFNTGSLSTLIALTVTGFSGTITTGTINFTINDPDTSLDGAALGSANFTILANP